MREYELTKLTVSVPAFYKAEIERESLGTGDSISSIARRALREYFADRDYERGSRLLGAELVEK